MSVDYDVVAVLVQMPAALKRAVVRRVRSEGSNANDVMVGALAKYYRVPFTPSGRRSAPGARGGPVVLRVPRLLKDRLTRDALEQERPNLSDRVLAVLAEAFGQPL
jgi:hypothetical protein